MPSLEATVRNVQNPAFGAVLLAAFVQGYYEADQTKEGTPLPFLYLVLPIILHSEMFRVLSGTRTGLRQMTEKLVSAEFADTDLLLSLQRRARNLRGLTAESIGIMLLTGLAHIDTASGRLIPRKQQQFETRRDIPGEANESRKLGKWFAVLSTFEIGSILKVTF